MSVLELIQLNRRIEELEAENKRLRDMLEDISTYSNDPHVVELAIDALKDRGSDAR